MVDRHITGYLSHRSVRPNDVIDVMISSDRPGPYEAHLVRLFGCDSASHPATFAEVMVSPRIHTEGIAQKRPVLLGSLAIANDVALGSPRALTLVLFVRLTMPIMRNMTIFELRSKDGPHVRIDVEKGGRAAALIGDEKLDLDGPLPIERWLMVALRTDQDRAAFTIEALGEVGSPSLRNWKQEAFRAIPGFCIPQRVDIGIAGSPDRTNCFTGRIESPSVYGSWLDEKQLQQIAAGERIDAALITSWEFSGQMGETLLWDTQRVTPLRLINGPMRAATGRLWDGTEHDWRRAADHYGAIHFHADDLDDAEWPADFSLRVSDLPSGLYAVKLLQDGDEGYLPFFILPGKGTKSSEIAFLAPTASYLAYANATVMFRAEALYPQFARVPAFEDFLVRHPNFGPSIYDRHEDGSGVVYSSWRRPILNLEPKTTPWAFTADGDIIAFFANKDIDINVLTDDILDAEGYALLKPYRVIVTGTHPEYYSEAMLQALDEFIAGGGRLIYLGGNGFYWRTSYGGERRDIIEVRRAEDGTRAWAARPGEYHHGFEGGILGGLWRRQGRAPQKLVGVGFSAQGFFGGGKYLRMSDSDTARASFIFEGVEDRTIGDFGAHGGGAVGEEIDRADVALGTPRHALIVATSDGLNAGMLRAKEELMQTMPASISDPDIRADVVFFETPSGGAVFSTGSISWAGSLSHNSYSNNIARITENVVRRFACADAFVLPDEESGHDVCDFDRYLVPLP